MAFRFPFTTPRRCESERERLAHIDRLATTALVNPIISRGDTLWAIREIARKP